MARALHDLGSRRPGPFIAINLAAIPRELIEAELFGAGNGDNAAEQISIVVGLNKPRVARYSLMRWVTCRLKLKRGC